MTPETAVNEILRGLGGRTRGRDKAVLELNSARGRLEKDPELPFWLISNFAEATTSGDSIENRVAVPADFLREYDEGALYIYDTTEDENPWVPLGKDYEDVLRMNLPGAGRPSHYALTGGYFVLFKIPAQAYTLRMKYYMQDATITDDGPETLYLKHAADLLISEAGLVMAEDLRDQTAVANFSRRRSEARARYTVDLVARDVAGKEMEIGGSD